MGGLQADADGDSRISYAELKAVLAASVDPLSLGVLPRRGTAGALAEARGMVAAGQGFVLEMEACGVAVELVACNALLDACVVAAAVGPLGEGEAAAAACEGDANAILQMMRSKGVVPNVRSYTALVGIWGVAAGRGMGNPAIDKALECLGTMKAAGVAPDVVVYNRVLDACARAAWADDGGGVEQALAVLDMMRREGVTPNAVSYSTLINAARHQGTDSSV